MFGNKPELLSKILRYWKVYLLLFFILTLFASALMTLCPVLPLFTDGSCSNLFEITNVEKANEPTPIDLELTINIKDLDGTKQTKFQYDFGYRCSLEGRPPYLRPSNRFRCVAKTGRPSHLKTDRNFSAAINVTWIEMNGPDKRSTTYDLTTYSEKENASTFTEEFYISVPSSNGMYRMNLNGEGSEEVSLTENTTGNAKATYRIHSYSEVLQYQNQQFQRRTIPFQVLVLILLVFNGFQLLISIFEYGDG